MISKNIKIGSHEDVTFVEFGSGDILIVGMDWDKENAHGILFSQDHPKDQEEWNSVPTPVTSIEEAKSPVILRFNNVDSVNQLILSLIEVRDSFISE